MTSFVAVGREGDAGHRAAVACERLGDLPVGQIEDLDLAGLFADRGQLAIGADGERPGRPFESRPDRAACRPPACCHSFTVRKPPRGEQRAVGAELQRLDQVEIGHAGLLVDALLRCSDGSVSRPSSRLLGT